MLMQTKSKHYIVFITNVLSHKLSSQFLQCVGAMFLHVKNSVAVIMSHVELEHDNKLVC